MDKEFMPPVNLLLLQVIPSGIQMVAGIGHIQELI